MSESWKLKNRRWHANVGMALALTLGLIALSCPFIAHKGGGSVGEILKDIHYGKFLPAQWRWIWIDGQGLGLAFLIFSGWLMHRKAVKKATNAAGDDPTAAGSSVTFVGLGNRETLDASAAKAEAAGLRCFRCEASAFAKLNLQNERWMVFTAGDGADCKEAMESVLTVLAEAPAGKAKRLEFCIDSSLDPVLTKKLSVALARAGARSRAADKMPASAAPPVKAAARNAALTASSAPGWTLIEMLLVLTLMLIITASIGSGMQWLARKESAKHAAAGFQSMIRDASLLARREMSPVRIVFALPETKKVLKQAGLADHEMKPAFGCRLLVFRVPGRNLPLQAMVSPTGSDDDFPAAPMARLPRAGSMGGGWTPAPRRLGWLKWEDALNGGDFLNDYRGGGFAAVSKVYQINPAQDSGYPEDFLRSPFHARDFIEPRVVEAGESMELAASITVDAAELSGDLPVPQWKKEVGDSFELPALDFLPDGSLACHESKEELTFRFGEPGTGAFWTVKVRTADAETWIE